MELPSFVNYLRILDFKRGWIFIQAPPFFKSVPSYLKGILTVGRYLAIGVKHPLLIDAVQQIFLSRRLWKNLSP